MGTLTGRRVLVAVAAVVALLAVAGIVVAGDEDPPPDGVRAVGAAGASEPATSVTSTAPRDEPTPTLVMGAVGDVAVEVTPRTNLADGATLTLTVDGADGLPDDAIVLMCTGEVVDDSSAATGCDPNAVTDLDGTVGPQLVEGTQQVVVSRFLQVASAGADPNVPGTYDCATEPAGCGLVLAPYRLPPTAVSVPLTFADEPVAASETTATPDVGLGDGQVVTVEASGLRPLAVHRIRQCVAVEGEAADEQAWSCDWQADATATTNERGDLLGAARVRAALYPTDGRVDCSEQRCWLVVESDASSAAAASVEIGFAGDTVAPTPQITLDPPGPYIDGQEVTLHGTGFPPGRDLSGELAQCPADRDTRVEERCGYDLDPVVVADDGTFTTSRPVWADLALSGACADTGCVIGWVIPKGATVAAVPIEVAPA